MNENVDKIAAAINTQMAALIDSVRNRSSASAVKAAVVDSKAAGSSTQIFVKTPNGKTITLDVDLRQNIEAVKHMIEEKEGVGIERQCLIRGDTVLDNVNTLFGQDIRSGDTLHLDIAPLPTANDSKAAVANSKAAGAAATASGGVDKFEICVEAPQQSGSTGSRITVSSRHTIREVKELISLEMNVPVNQQRLVHRGFGALKDRYTVGYYRIVAGDVIEMTELAPSGEACMQIIVKMSNGKSLVLKVGSSDTIGSVKRQIEKVEHIPFDEQHLVFCCNELENEATLAGSSINAHATLHLVNPEVAAAAHRIKGAPLTGH